MPWVKIAVTKLPYAMIINELKVIKLFCELNDFTQAFDKYEYLVGKHCPQSFHKPEASVSEMMCIEILYHQSGYKCFQYYYKQEVEKGCLECYFPKAPSYSRFVQLDPGRTKDITEETGCNRIGE